MNDHFPRIITLLRKEKDISQKQAAAHLGISQALLSHYEKGIRECGLDFLVRCTHYYGVSCDYLLGCSPDRQGCTLQIDDIADPDSVDKENRSPKTILTTLNKKLIANSLNIIFDLLSKANCKALTSEISTYLMLAVYRAFRIIYSTNPKNQQALFSVPLMVSSQYANASMQICEANSNMLSQGNTINGLEPMKSVDKLSISTESLAEDYPLFSSSILNLIQTSEARIGINNKTNK